MIESETRLEGAPNFRDLGGYPTVDGRKVRRGRVFRSDGLHALSERDFDDLSRLGLRLVCDLRSEYERKRKPTVWPQRFVPKTLLMEVNADPRVNHAGLLEMLHHDSSPQGAAAMMSSVYRLVPGMLAQYIPSFFSALVSNDQLPLVFHCSAGKDRTGILSAIILLALGVPREVVFEDYLKTVRYQNRLKLLLHVDEFLEPIYAPARPPQEVASILMGVERRFLEEALAVMGERDGRIDDYLLSAGVTQEQIERMRNRLLIE
ncbi:Protein-tyrosine phosphatase [Georgfuchsia toluolica]|uniref:Protein-tyrosine phosphatase n=1 Tax=Georgfuchsia toluolica TaxID=424218 RepID=A0A916J377_9PROT|nr:tyrosine-protein phosphatase [Georgfuchsia toluolica]CAG4883141.1 Protein-tyrosine phosphatase [Georgfuchsia toluolica]